MLPSLSRGLRLAMILGLSTTYIAWHSRDAFARKHHKSDDDSGDSDSDSGDSDSDSGDDGGDDGGGGDDSADSGGGDDGGGGGGDDSGDDSDDDKDQPPVTAGGLFTIKSYPVNELQRPLTMTQKITQVRVSVGTDISAKGAFGSGGLSVEGTYGVKDNFTLLGGFTNAYNMRQYSVYAGFEGSLVYDLLDIRLAADLHRSAFAEYANYCSPVSTGDPKNPSDPSQCGAPMASIVTLPDGTYHAGDTQFSLDLGFPFRYAFTPQIAIVALQTLFKIDFNSAARDHVLVSSVTDMATGMMTTKVSTAPNGAKPDLVPSIGLATNPIPQLSVLAYGQFIVPDFDTSAGAFQVPVTLRVEASPTQKLDFGLAFTLLNVMPPDGQSPIDNRFVSAYVQARY